MMLEKHDRGGRLGGLRWFVPLTILLIGIAWCWWPALGDMVQRWSHDPRYSHGFLVPAFAGYLLWSRRAMLASTSIESSGWGLLLIAMGAALKLAGTRFYFSWVDSVALLPCLAGVALLIGGRRALRWSWPAIAFLVFMIPLPYRLEMALGYPLQRIATLASNYSLQTLGLPAVAEGNVIFLDDVRIGVVEACNGLGMLFTFLALAVGMAVVVERRPLDRVLIILSAVPIALAANITRITMTGLLHATVGGRVADAVYHDLAGWLMMPMALTVLWAELFLLSHLLVSRSSKPAPSLGPMYRRS